MNEQEFCKQWGIVFDKIEHHVVIDEQLLYALLIDFANQPKPYPSDEKINILLENLHILSKSEAQRIVKEWLRDTYQPITPNQERRNK